MNLWRGLEDYLRNAEVLAAWRLDRGGNNSPSYDLLLGGGISVICKPADEGTTGERGVKNEVAAWIMARDLGWSDLVATAVLRIIPSFISNEPVLASVQALWPELERVPDLESLPEEPVARAAVYDTLIAMSDRVGFNWLAVGGGSPAPRLALVDHAFAFGYPPERAFASVFHRRWGPRALQEGDHQALEGWLTRELSNELRALLPQDALDGVRRRAEWMVAEARLVPSEQVL